MTQLLFKDSHLLSTTGVNTRKSHCKILTTNTQTDSLSGKNTEKQSDIKSEKSQCCWTVYSVTGGAHDRHSGCGVRPRRGFY